MSQKQNKKSTCTMLYNKYNVSASEELKTKTVKTNNWAKGKQLLCVCVCTQNTFSMFIFFFIPMQIPIEGFFLSCQLTNYILLCGFLFLFFVYNNWCEFQKRKKHYEWVINVRKSEICIHINARIAVTLQKR